MRHATRRLLARLALLPMLAGCGETEAADDTTAETGDGDPGDGDGEPGDGDGDPGDGDGDPGDGDPGDGDGDPGGCPGEVVPQTEAELIAWLEGGGYADWTAESGVHASAGPHFGGVRTFVDDCLAGSLDDGANQHPPGSATIKELYGDGAEPLGWSVMVKVGPGSGGDTWYWFELYQDTVYADGVDAQLCTGCHGGGTDFVLTPWPLQ